MTDEEIQQSMQNLSERIDEISNSDKPLSKEERRRHHLLLLQQETLKRIKEARDKKNFSQELSHTITYGLLTSWGEKHPFLVHFLQSKFRLQIF